MVVKKKPRSRKAVPVVAAVIVALAARVVAVAIAALVVLAVAVAIAAPVVLAVVVATAVRVVRAAIAAAAAAAADCTKPVSPRWVPPMEALSARSLSAAT